MFNIKRKKPKFGIGEIVYTVEHCVSFFVKEWIIKKRRLTWLGNWRYTIDDHNYLILGSSTYPSTIKEIKESKIYKTKESAKIEVLKRNRG